MKQSERIEKLEQTLVDLQRQMTDVRKEMKMSVAPVPARASLAYKIAERIAQLKRVGKVPEGRDLFSTEDIEALAQGVSDSDLMFRYDSNTVRRLLSKQLVDSGLFTRFTGQQHQSGYNYGDGEEFKRRNIKHRYFCVGRGTKYKRMTQNQMFKEYTLQEKENDRLVSMIEHQKKIAPVANDVSFL